jgi:hypothetical protein
LHHAYLVHDFFAEEMAMHAMTSVLLVGSLVALSYLSCETSHGETDGGEASMFRNPQEVFDAFRLAHAKRDWRTVLSCFTPRAKEDAIFEVYFNCNILLHDPRVRTLLAKHNIQPERVDAEYLQRHQKKQKEERATLTQGVAPQVASQVKRPDRELLKVIVNEQVVDADEFFESASDIIFKERLIPEIGGLTCVSVSSNSACGDASKTVFHLETRAGQPEQVVAQKLEVEYAFCKVRGGWLIDRQL